MLTRYNPPGVSEAEIMRRWEVLTLAGNNFDERFPAPKLPTDFWNWCGLRPERWAIVPDQALWEEFTREFQLHGGQYIAKWRGNKQEINFLMFDPRLSFNGSSSESDWTIIHAGRANEI